jgi:hypothetical protein
MKLSRRHEAGGFPLALALRLAVDISRMQYCVLAGLGRPSPGAEFGYPAFRRESLWPNPMISNWSAK